MVKVRAVAALAALIAFPLFVLALIGGAVVLGAWLAAGGHSIVVVIKFLGIPLLAALWFGVKTARAARHDVGPEGPELTRNRHPRLWQEVDALAVVAQTEPPARITMVPEVNAAVLEVSGRREMVIGLPLLATFTVGELRSVLAHELGHYAGGDTALSARTARARVFLMAVAQRSDGVVRPLLLAYARLYAWVSNAASRDAERAADGFSLRVAGSTAAARAMERLVATDLAWGALNRDYVGLFPMAGARASLADGLNALMAANAPGLEKATTEILANERPSWRDTHPSTASRIAAFRSAATESASEAPDGIAADRPAADLLEPGWLDEAEGSILVHQLPMVSWPELVTRAVGSGVAGDVKELSDRLARGGVEGVGTYGGLVQTVLRDPSVCRALTQTTAPAFDPENDRKAAEGVLNQAVAAALVAGREVRVAESWDGPWRLVDASTGEVVEVAPRVEAALASEQGRDELLAWMAGHGAALDRQPEVPTRAGSSA